MQGWKIIEIVTMDMVINIRNQFCIGCLFNGTSKELDVIKNLLDNGKDVYLLCYEKATDNCHRHLLRNILKEYGYEGEEFNSINKK